MGGLFLLLVLCAIMTLASFLAGVLPISLSMSKSRMRLVSSIGVGVLVGTALIVIIPEGIEAATSPSEATHIHKTRALLSTRSTRSTLFDRSVIAPGVYGTTSDKVLTGQATSRSVNKRIPDWLVVSRSDDAPPSPLDQPADEPAANNEENEEPDHHGGTEIPTLEVGLSLTLGFILMLLIDRLPRHASESLKPATPETHHISLENLGGGGDTASVAGDTEGLIDSMTPSPRQSRSLATTLGLVIHAAADGIAMGASATTADMKLGFVIFAAIMIHKAPAAFGLTSVLLNQGLSKRAARGHLIVFSLAAPAGALSTWFLVTLMGGSQHIEGETGQYWAGMLLLFSGGTFLYVAMHAMEEDSSGHDHGHGGANGFGEGSTLAQRRSTGPRTRDTIATTIGMLLPLLAQFGQHGH